MNFTGLSVYPSNDFQAYQILQDESAESRDWFYYNTAYTIKFRAFNNIITNCNGPCQAHEAPGEADYRSMTIPAVQWRPAKPQGLAVKETLDRSVIITFAEPTNAHGSPITHYVYQIWETSSAGSATPTDCGSLGASAWCSRKYMCNNDAYTPTTGWSSNSDDNYMNKGIWGRPTVCSGSLSIANTLSWHTTDGFRLTDGSPYVRNAIEDKDTLQPETSYTVVVRAVNAYGTGWSSDPVSFTTKTVPSTPTLSSQTSRTLTIAWNEYNDGGVATAYKVYCNGDFQTGGNGMAWAYTKQTLEATDVTSLLHTFENLTPGQAYTFWVKAVTLSGSDTGPSYTSAAFSTPEDIPDTPLVVSVVAGGSKKSRGFEVLTTLPYHNRACTTTPNTCSNTALSAIEVSVNPAGTAGASFLYSSSLKTVSKAIPVTGLTPNVEYSIEVRIKSGTSSNTERWSSKSTAILHTTCDEEPEQISTVSALNGEKTTMSIILRWEAPNNGGAAITKFWVRASRASYNPLTPLTSLHAPSQVRAHALWRLVQPLTFPCALL